MTMAATEAWLRAMIAETAARLVVVCHGAIFRADFSDKIRLGRIMHDEAQLLQAAVTRLGEVATDRDTVPQTLAAGMATRRAAVGEGLCALLQADPPPLASPPLDDEPTHRLRAGWLNTRARQRSEASAGACPAQLPSLLTLAGIAAVLARADGPARPAGLRIDDARTPAGLGDDQARAALMHQNLVNLEIPTIEMCASVILEFPGMPLAFVCDMARQAWDEARHAEMFWRRLEALGATLEDFSAATTLWRMCRGQKLAVRLAIHQCHGEWIGVDGAAWFGEAAQAQGDTATAALFDAILRDELNHVRMGNRWLRHLCPDPASRAEARGAAARRRDACGKPCDGPLVFPLRPELCRAAEFEDTEIDRLARRYARHGSFADPR